VVAIDRERHVGVVNSVLERHVVDRGSRDPAFLHSCEPIDVFRVLESFIEETDAIED
jgi:hypothetical protein